MFDAMDPALDWIRNGLGKPGKNQRSLAGALGVDPSAISRLLAGTRQLRAAELPVVAAYLEAEIPADFSPATHQNPHHRWKRLHPPARPVRAHEIYR